MRTSPKMFDEILIDRQFMLTLLSFGAEILVKLN